MKISFLKHSPSDILRFDESIGKCERFKRLMRVSKGLVVLSCNDESIAKCECERGNVATLDDLLDLPPVIVCISGTTALRYFLADLPEVKEIKEEIKLNNITMEDIYNFTKNLLRDLETGILFPHDRTLAALVVALEGVNHLYIKQLSNMYVAEMPYSTKIAREIIHGS